MNLNGHADQQGEEALERFRVLRPAVEEGVPLARAAAAKAVPLRTAQRWMAAYKREGLPGLGRKPRGGRDHCHKLPKEIVAAIEGLSLMAPRPSMASVQRRAAEIAALKGWPEPSYRQVRGVIGRIDPALAKLAHEGEGAYAQAFDLLHRHEAERPNDLWQVDHKHLDVLLDDGSGERKKPWLTAILDDHSRAVPGYFLHFEAPSSVHVALALRQGIRRKADPRWPVCGVPDALYTDRGKDFKSRYVEQVAADLGMRLVFGRPLQPRGRGKIERFFRTVEQLFLREAQGYAPGKFVPAGPLPTLPRFDAVFREWLLDSYHRREHSGTGEGPVERWRGGAFVPKMPDRPERLDLLLLTVAQTRRVRRDGIHFSRNRYLDTVLAAYVGEDVLVRYDPRDLAEIRVYHQGVFLCRAVCPELAGEEVSLREIRNAATRRKRELKSKLRERTAAAEELLALRRGELAVEMEMSDAPELRGVDVPDGEPLKLYEDD